MVKRLWIALNQGCMIHYISVVQTHFQIKLYVLIQPHILFLIRTGRLKQFYTSGFESSEGRKYSKYIGLTVLNQGFMGGSSVMNLVGCFINGQLRGDTNMIVGIHSIGTEIPKQFSSLPKLSKSV